MEPGNLKELYILGLKKMHSVEQKMVDAMSNMVKAAENESLQQAFQEHQQETSTHADRLNEILGGLDESEVSMSVPGIDGLINEVEEALKMDVAGGIKDACLIGAAQMIEHMEIAAYGTLCTYAKILGYTDDLEKLKTSLSEEKDADSKLNELAKDIANQQASAE